MKNFLIDFTAKYLRPFWFSKSCQTIKVPYVYNWAIMVVFIAMIILFGYMAYEKYDASILMVVSAVIATLAGLYVGIIAMYEKSKKEVKK